MDAMAIPLLVTVVVLGILWHRARGKTKALEKARAEQSVLTKQLQARLNDLEPQIQKLMRENDSLRPFSGVRDAAAEAARLLTQAQVAAAAAAAEGERDLTAARTEAERMRQALVQEARDKRGAIERQLADAGTQAARIIEDAKKRAEAIGGDAYRALEEANGLQAKIQAMKNVIEGYGDRYMVPTHSLLDELAQAYLHTEAGQELKQARERSKLMASQGRAAECEYVERGRKDTAIRFVVDAFNGKVDSILTRAKVDNFGTLTQEIKDAAALVNLNGAAFKNARVKPEYVDARIEELKWAVRAHELREREREEQRRIREQIREEERARREYERAMKEAAREEEIVRKALEKARNQLLRASEDQRQAYEEQIRQLNARLTSAEEKNQRALSMAQQTKAGHVYVISNVGSFGEHVYKIGMTRRLEPLDRVRELGDASVPFSFDVHAMIWSDNAPALETALHRQFVQAQLNKINPRKEFFRISVADIRQVVESLDLHASWTMTAEAREFRESLALEQKIAVDARARETWIRDQMAFEADGTDEIDAVGNTASTDSVEESASA
jgi:hypothetical protein